MYKIDILDEVLIERVNKAILANVEKAKLFKFESGQKFNSFIKIMSEHAETHEDDHSELLYRIMQLMGEYDLYDEFMCSDSLPTYIEIVDCEVLDNKFASFMILDEMLYIYINDRRIEINGIEYEDIYNEFYDIVFIIKNLDV